MSPLIGTTAPLSPIRTEYGVPTYTSGNATTSASVYGDGGIQQNMVGSGAARAYAGAGGVWGLTVQPAAGADVSLIMGWNNGGQAVITQFIAMLQGGPNPLPGTRWEARFRLPVVCNLQPNAAGVDSWIGLAMWLDSWGVLFSRPRGWGIFLGAIGDAGGNFRIYAQDGPLGSGGVQTLNVDTGVPFSTTVPQRLEWWWGNDGTNNFVRAVVDGVTVWDPALPVAAGLTPTSSVTGPILGVLRGADAADVVAPVVPDYLGGALYVDVYP